MTPGTTIGRYVVKRKLAEGGMAEILLCAVRGPEGFEKEVVLKRIRSHFAADAGFVRMFVDEARVVSRLHHPNIVQVFDFDQHEDTYYLAMEYVRGKSLWDLRKRCREQGTPVPPVLSAFMAAEVARALDHAHGLSENGKRLGVVHRDVTPHNVLLSFDGAVKLADFGIVKSNAGLTAPGTLKGKLAYMSPEQARGERVDARTDVFALGIVLWELLTGGRLFEGGNEIAILRAVQQSAIVPPARLNPDVPSPLSEVVERALQRDVEARFQTAAEMERALREVLLAHARTVEDTDAGAFLRRMFPEAAGQEGAAAFVSGREQPTAPGRAPRGQGPERQARGSYPSGRALDSSLPAAEEAPTLVVRPTGMPPEPSRLTAGPQLGMKQALGLGAAAVLAGAVLAAAVGTWQGRGRGEGAGEAAQSIRGAPLRATPAAGPPREARIRVEQEVALGSLAAVATDGGEAIRSAGEDMAAVSGSGSRPSAQGPAEVEAGGGARAAAAQASEPASPALAREGRAPAAGKAVPAGHPAGDPALAGSVIRNGVAPERSASATPGRGAGTDPANGAPTGSVRSAPGQSAPRTAAASAPGAPREPGKILLRVVPWAQAWLDGRPLGEVGPQREIPTEAGDHQLRLEHPRGTRQLSVHVEPGEVTALALDMLAP